MLATLQLEESDSAANDESPAVSICLPNLNTRPFLPERFQSIFDQTFKDWELIVCDSFSDDGSWEYIQELAAREPRLRISQTPRNGIYAGFNDCIKLARGRYVYIATSDDTMMPDCLEKMVAALEENPDCGLCQCNLLIIDEKSAPIPESRQWSQGTLASYNPKLVASVNKRLAPHDGMLVPALYTIYSSVTQLLIRKSVFERIGLFDGQWGSVGDFEWGMRAGLVENCIYIPDQLATWRLHANQATQQVHTAELRVKMIDMCRTALQRAVKAGGKNLKEMDSGDLTFFLERDLVQMRFENQSGKFRKLFCLLKQFPEYPRASFNFIINRIQRKRWNLWHSPPRYACLEQLLKRYNVPAPVFPATP